MTGATELILGYSTDEIQAFGCWGRLVLEEDRPLFEKNVTGLAPVPPACASFACARGMGVWAGSPLTLGARPPEARARRRIYGALVNISDRKRAEEELLEATHTAQAANRAKSEFPANMSHVIHKATRRLRQHGWKGPIVPLLAVDCPINSTVS